MIPIRRIPDDRGSSVESCSGSFWCIEGSSESSDATFSNGSRGGPERLSSEALSHK